MNRARFAMSTVAMLLALGVAGCGDVGEGGDVSEPAGPGELAVLVEVEVTDHAVITEADERYALGRRYSIEYHVESQLATTVDEAWVTLVTFDSAGERLTTSNERLDDVEPRTGLDVTTDIDYRAFEDLEAEPADVAEVRAVAHGVVDAPDESDQPVNAELLASEAINGVVMDPDDSSYFAGEPAYSYDIQIDTDLPGRVSFVMVMLHAVDSSGEIAATDEVTLREVAAGHSEQVSDDFAVGGFRPGHGPADVDRIIVESYQVIADTE